MISGHFVLKESHAFLCQKVTKIHGILRVKTCYRVRTASQTTCVFAAPVLSQQESHMAVLLHVCVCAKANYDDILCKWQNVQPTIFLLICQGRFLGAFTLDESSRTRQIAARSVCWCRTQKGKNNVSPLSAPVATGRQRARTSSLLFWPVSPMGAVNWFGVCDVYCLCIGKQRFFACRVHGCREITLYIHLKGGGICYHYLCVCAVTHLPTTCSCLQLLCV